MSKSPMNELLLRALSRYPKLPLRRSLLLRRWDERARSTSTSEKSPRSERKLGDMLHLSLSCPRMLESCEEIVDEATETSSLPFVAVI